MIERRRCQRVEFLCEAFLCEAAIAALPHGRPLSARSIDLSVDGVGLITQATFTLGQLIAVSFFLKDTAQGKFHDQVMGKVVHFREDGDANCIGVEFLEPLNESQHPELMKRLLAD